MKTIKLTKGKETIVDDEDFDRINKLKWYYHGNYAARSVYGGTIRLHRFIMNCPDELQVDHINGDFLDNRKCNLRIVTNTQNNRNRGKHKDNTSGFKGVYWNKTSNKWYACICVNYKNIYLGRYDTKERAALAYNDAVKKYFGEYGVLNVIE